MCFGTITCSVTLKSKFSNPNIWIKYFFFIYLSFTKDSALFSLDADNGDGDDGEEVKEEDLDKEDYGEDEYKNDDDDDNYNEDNTDYDDLINIDYNQVKKCTNRSRSKNIITKTQEKDQGNIVEELEQHLIHQLLKKENTLKTVKRIIEVRQKIIKIIQTLFPKNNKVRSREVERGIYNYSIDRCVSKDMFPSWDNVIFREIYLSKSKSIYTNLNSKSYVKNRDLIHKILLEEIQPEKLAYMTPVEVFPEMWEHIIRENEHREKVITESMMGSATDKFVCPNKKCRARKSVYTEVQTRSADEPMTLFITCLVCGQRWRM